MSAPCHHCKQSIVTTACAECGTCYCKACLANKECGNCLGNLWIMKGCPSCHYKDCPCGKCRRVCRNTPLYSCQYCGLTCYAIGGQPGYEHPGVPPAVDPSPGAKSGWVTVCGAHCK